MHSQDSRPIDLLDAVASKLEHIRTVTWAVADQVDRLSERTEVTEVVSGEVGLIYNQLIEAQQLIDQLTGSMPA